MLHEYEDILLDAEEQDNHEGSNVERNTLTELQNMQNEDNNDIQNEDNNQTQNKDNNQTQNDGQTQSAEQNDTNIPDKHNSQFKSSLKSNQGTLQNKPDYKTLKISQFKSNEIEKLIEYSLYQDKPIYKVKFTGKPGTIWQDGLYIPENLKQEYHRQYNEKG